MLTFCSYPDAECFFCLADYWDRRLSVSLAFQMGMDMGMEFRSQVFLLVPGAPICHAPNVCSEQWFDGCPVAISGWYQRSSFIDLILSIATNASTRTSQGNPRKRYFRLFHYSSLILQSCISFRSLSKQIAA